jgi:hypothetical protein
MPTLVYSIRIDDTTKKMMEEMDDEPWQEEIRRLVEDTVREKHKQKLLERARERANTGKKGVPAAGLIREDRDA